MMVADEDGKPTPIGRDLLKPYASVVLLQCHGIESAAAYDLLWKWLKKARRVQGSNTNISVVGLGFALSDDPSPNNQENDGDEGLDQVDVMVHRVERKPNWLVEPTFVNVNHELTLALRVNDLIAVHAAPTVRDALQRWLDKPPRPHVRRVSAQALEQALLGGESKSLWLRSTQSPKSTKADSKAVVGIDLRDSLMPFEDSTYMMGSARAALDESADRNALTGAVGTTPQASVVWNRQMDTFRDYLQCMRELLVEVRQALEHPSGDAQFPLLSQRVEDLANVRGAYDISVTSPYDLPVEPGLGEDKFDASQVLSNALLDVIRDEDSANFRVRVGLNGTEAGVVRGRVEIDAGHASITFGYVGNPTDHESARVVLDSLSYTDLLTIYYETGHVLTSGQMSKPYINSQPFKRWEFRDFEGYRIDREKPNTKIPQEIHDRIGIPGEDSLFSWAAKHYSEGWLTCDDGSGEMADFIYVDPAGNLKLIHIKGAESRSHRRKISGKAYEVVVSQAMKNIAFLEHTRLIEHLEKSPVDNPACWSQGERVSDRSEIIEAVELSDARVDREIVIVQPHISKVRYDRLYDELSKGMRSDDLLRLNRVENLLNANRPSAVGVGADLVVVASS